MALNATVGSPDANSYVTVDEAEAYFADRVHSAVWTTFVDKEALLVTSSQMIDWYFKWKGQKVTETQNMDWPRMSAIRASGLVIDDTALPAELKVAVYEMALSSILSDRTSDNAMFGLEQVKAGSLMVKSSESIPETAKETIPDKVTKILYDLCLRGGFGTVRLMRA